LSHSFLECSKQEKIMTKNKNKKKDNSIIGKI